MKSTIIILTDYKGYFGSKWDSVPYRSGFNKLLLEKYFKVFNYKVKFVCMSDISTIGDVSGSNVLYTSSEDKGYHYKDFIEDVVYYLQLQGANIIPGYSFLKANNNKVFMELLKNQVFNSNLSLKSYVFGSLEEMMKKINKIDFPIVLKEPKGALSRGVYLAKTKNDLIRLVKKITKTNYFFHNLKDDLRSFKHENYIKESKNRKKFILQQFIPNLTNDWKVLIYGDKYFIFERSVRKGDFRASGSGVNNYKYGSNCNYPDGIFDYVENIYSTLNVPNLSIDIAFDGDKFFMLEYQAINFGTVGYTKSDVFFVKNNKKWKSVKKEKCIEQIFVESIIQYLKKNSIN